MNAKLLVLGGFGLGLAFIATRKRTAEANGARINGARINGVRSSNTGGYSGVGRVETFPITSTSHNKVESIVYEMLVDARTSPSVEALAESILAEKGIPFQPSLDAAVAIHRYVADSVPKIPDPPAWEHITDPGTLSAIIMNNGELPVAGLDCDDAATLAAALYQIVGMPSTVCFLDFEGDGMIDHAIPMVDIPGRGLTFAETMVRGVPLGWVPSHVSAECLAMGSE